MSRSRRSQPWHGITTARSEKKDKRIANRSFRRVVRHRLSAQPEVLPEPREVSDIWCMDKDGKLRFDPERFPELMRK